MIVVFVRYQDGVKCRDVFSNRGQTFGNLAAAETGIDQDTRTACGNKRGIPGAAAGENADFDDTCFSLTFSSIDIANLEQNVRKCFDFEDPFVKRAQRAPPPYAFSTGALYNGSSL